MKINEWQDLPDLQAVAKAQADGWEIECSYPAWDWMPWHGYTWHHTFSYRGRTRQPTMKEVKMECWFINGHLNCRAVFQAGAAIRDAEIAELVAALKPFGAIYLVESRLPAEFAMLILRARAAIAKVRKQT